jgi:hypothetical protein
MTSEPAGAYSAEVDTGLVTALRPDILIVSILLPLTGFHHEAFAAAGAE